jgi:hypothetical protein
MLTIDHLLAVASAYAAAADLQESVLSWRMFGDNRRLAQLRDGREITVGRFNAAMIWMARHWPDGHPLPADLIGYRAAIVDLAGAA